MKTEEELKAWFWDLYNSCYVIKNIKYPNIEFLFYDEIFNRQAKLKTILGEEIIYPTKSNGECLFVIEYDNWFNVHYDIIWYIITTETTERTYFSTSLLIKSYLQKHDKLKTLNPIRYNPKYDYRLQLNII